MSILAFITEELPLVETVSSIDGNGNRDYALFSPAMGKTAIWYLSGATVTGGAYGPTLPARWQLMAIGDFNNDGHPDFVIYNSATRQTANLVLKQQRFCRWLVRPDASGWLAPGQRGGF
jgi:hypothetical protein